jgi:hypothetical protein
MCRDGKTLENKPHPSFSSYLEGMARKIGGRPLLFDPTPTLDSSKSNQNVILMLVVGNQIENLKNSKILKFTATNDKEPDLTQHDQESPLQGRLLKANLL